MNYRKKIITSLLHQHNKWNKTAATLTIEQIEPYVIAPGNREKLDEFMLEARKLKKEGFLRIQERKNDYPKLVITDDVEIIVSFAKRERIYTINEYIYDCLKILNEFTNADCPQLNEYCVEQINNLNNRKKIPEHKFDQTQNNSYYLRELLIGALAVYNQTEDVLIRNFSVSIYGDSKKFANYMNKICKILAPSEIEDEVDCYTILNNYHIYQNPTTATIKGNFKITFDNGDSIHGRADSSMSLGDSFIFSIKEINCERIISIENLTSFNCYIPKEGELVVYLGGFANGTTINLIKKAITPDMKFYHFGDIDAGGFYILLKLENRIEHPIIPYKMSITELTKYSEITKTLTVNDISKLNSIKTKDSRFNDVINYMLNNNCKLEQESLDSFSFEY